MMLLAGFLSGCQWSTQLRPDAKSIQVVLSQDEVKNCHTQGILIGTNGHWYNYLFLANDLMMQSALNDLRNQAASIGADTLLLPNYAYTFVTSVTIMGEALQCRKSAPRD
jgi:hypothetical protein